MRRISKAEVDLLLDELLIEVGKAAIQKKGPRKIRTAYDKFTMARLQYETYKG